MNFSKNKKKIMVISFEIMMIGIALILIFLGRIKNNTVCSDIGKWKSNYVNFDGEWCIDESIYNSDTTIVMIYGPYVEVNKGRYTVNVQYECDYNQEILPYAGDGNESYIKTGEGTLYSYINEVSYRFRVTEDINNLEIQVRYNGKGNLKISNIEIKSDDTLYFNVLFILICFIILFDIIYFTNIPNKRAIIWSLVLIVFLSSLPLFSKGIHTGHDLGFHLMRIEKIAEELKRGVFPVRLYSYSVSGYGYPSSIFYGDIFLYIPAIMRLLGFTVSEAYKGYVVFINVITVIISFISFRVIFKRQDIALILTMTYSFSTYRLVDLYVRSAVGEYTAIAFFPLIAMAVFNIYSQDISNWSEYRRNALFLALGMSGIIECHILSVEMAIVVLIIISIMLIKKTFRPRTIKVYLIAILETLLINCWFIVPFFDYCLNVPVHVNSSGNSVAKIQDNGAYIFQYFSFGQSVFGNISSQINERMSLTPGFILMGGLLIAVTLWILGRTNKQMKFFIVVSIGILIIASNVFPWNHLAKSCIVGNFLSKVQFPFRYISMANIMLTLLFGYTFMHIEKLDLLKKHELLFAVVFIGISGVITFYNSYSDGATTTEYYDNVNFSVGGGEYLLCKTDINILNNLNGKIANKNLEEAYIISRNGTNVRIFCKSTDLEGELIVPLFNYKGYEAVDSYGNTYELESSENGEMKIIIPENYLGEISINYRVPWYWRISEGVSALIIVGLNIYYLGLHLKRHKMKDIV